MDELKDLVTPSESVGNCAGTLAALEVVLDLNLNLGWISMKEETLVSIVFVLMTVGASEIGLIHRGHNRYT